MPPETAFTRVEQLVKKFKALSPHTRRDYNEDNTRKDFILPLFQALEWNITDKTEVCAEDRVSRGWVDFSFRIDGVPRLFLETKKIAEDLTKPRIVRQAIDYAWTKSVTWALLSDFEWLKVFNAEWQEDNPQHSLFLDFNVDSYLTDFKRLWWLSRPEISVKTLDNQAEKVGMKARRQPVSQHLFDDLKTWRHELFRHLHAYNPVWSPGDIDKATLHILNRLIFIRTAEDRQVEERLLLPLVRELHDQRRIQRLLEDLNKLFGRFNEIYDSQLFEPGLADTLDCEPQPFEKVIEGMYGKNNMLYNFNAIDADVLGTAYEQYLGYVIADPEASAEVVERRAKRKSQGIYYTPTFVVKYIVQQTVGRLLEEKGYHPSRPPRILDMACGSGSFLIEAFETLDRYVARLRAQDSGSKGGFHDHARQMEILTQCIYGVDKDEQAVEVARLNLMLKALHSKEKLPLLDHIRCGDSLISGKAEELQEIFGDNWQEKKPFDWQAVFPEVFQEGGFDVVIGNPPYVRQETLGKEFKNYAQINYTMYSGTADLYLYFIEQAMKLLKPGGILGFIVANKWMRANYGKPLREWLKKQHIIEIVDFGDLPVFQSATTYPCILIICKGSETQEFTVTKIKTLDFNNIDEVVRKHSFKLDQSNLSETGWSLETNINQPIHNKIFTCGKNLDDYVSNRIFRGIVTGNNKAFIVSKSVRDVLILKDTSNESIIKPWLIGREIKRYMEPYSNNFLIYSPWELRIDEYPSIKTHLTNWERELRSRPEVHEGRYNWWCMSRYGSEYVHEFDNPKIIAPAIVNRATFTIDLKGYYSNDKTSIICNDDYDQLLYLLGILNSKVSNFLLNQIASTKQGGYFEQKPIYLSQIPIPQINLNNQKDLLIFNRIISLVTEMLQLHKDRTEAEANFDNDRKRDIEHRISEIDAEIDQLVYRLYDLTEEEIKVVEE